MLVELLLGTGIRVGSALALDVVLVHESRAILPSSIDIRVSSGDNASHVDQAIPSPPELLHPTFELQGFVKVAYYATTSRAAVVIYFGAVIWSVAHFLSIRIEV